MMHGDYLLMQEATSDEYIELLHRQEEGLWLIKKN
jgi:hypothetical protein